MPAWQESKRSYSLFLPLWSLLRAVQLPFGPCPRYGERGPGSAQRQGTPSGRPEFGWVEQQNDDALCPFLGHHCRSFTNYVNFLPGPAPTFPPTHRIFLPDGWRFRPAVHFSLFLLPLTSLHKVISSPPLLLFVFSSPILFPFLRTRVGHLGPPSSLPPSSPSS